MDSINKRNTFNFNKQIIFGEVGALIGAPLIAYIISRFTSNSKFISFFAVIGAIVGQAILWLSTRTYDKKKEGNFSIKNLIGDLIYFTPMAFLLTLFVYYPTIYFVADYLISDHYKVIYSVISSQILAFSLFLIVINLYRYFLAKYYNKVL
ncbi:MAG: hypothetical protein ABIH65_02550 [Nanoarchaeota archaeon]